MAIVTKAKQWGNSVGAIIPTSKIKELSIKPGDEIEITVKKKHNVLKELFGSIQIKKPTKVILKEVREDMKSKWM
jgi:antitoxin component of MazEF toxin-antitoxin module